MNYVRLGPLDASYLHSGNLHERRSAVHVLWRTVLAGSVARVFLFLCTREESPGDRALVALSPTLDSLMLVCTAISPSKPIIPAAWCRRPVIPVFVTCRRKWCVLLDPNPSHFFDIATNPLLLPGSGRPLVSLSQLCLSNPEIPIMLYSEHENTHARFVAYKTNMHHVLQAYMYCVVLP